MQVHYGFDDGVEHFGATDHMDHIVITGARDDSFDWGQGYRGTAQFVLIIQARDDGDRGIEADNDGGNPLAGAGVPADAGELHHPRSGPTAQKRVPTAFCCGAAPARASTTSWWPTFRTPAWTWMEPPRRTCSAPT